jgi:hypothetical protein
MEIIGMLYLMFIWPAIVGWSGSERGMKLIEAIAVGMLPIMIVLALK